MWWWRRKRSLPIPAAWNEWTPQQRRAWMRHPMHERRCWCGTYGLPGEDMIALAADNGQRILHGEEMCQPEREALL